MPHLSLGLVPLNDLDRPVTAAPALAERWLPLGDDARCRPMALLLPAPCMWRLLACVRADPLLLLLALRLLLLLAERRAELLLSLRWPWLL